MIRAPLNNAKALLASGQESNLVYASLELRFAIESHVYKKLEFHAKRHGKKLLYKHWQPNKAIKVLGQLEPKANLSYQLSIAEETGADIQRLDYKLVGSHYALSVAWINKTYNKLGFYLHLQPESGELASVDRKFLEDVITELEKAEKGSLLSNFANTTIFECLLCHESITCCEEALLDLDEVVCSNDQCIATYEPIQEGTDWVVKLKTLSFNCPDCKSISQLATKELVIGQRVVCSICKSRFQIAGNEWKLYKIVN